MEKNEFFPKPRKMTVFATLICIFCLTRAAKTVAGDSGFASGDCHGKPRIGLWAKVLMIDSDNCALLLAISNSDDLHRSDMLMRARDAIFEVSAPRGRFSFLKPREATSFS